MKNESLWETYLFEKSYLVVGSLQLSSVSLCGQANLRYTMYYSMVSCSMRVSHRGVVANVLDFKIVVSEFEYQSNF